MFSGSSRGLWKVYFFSATKAKKGMLKQLVGKEENFALNGVK
jgi:hypothetical protein